MKIMILGAGGVGGYIGARLIRYSDSDVALVARGKHLQAIQTNGLKIVEDDSEWIAHPNIATDDTSKLGYYDIIFITVKSTSLRDALSSISDNISEKTVIIPLLNGVDHDKIIKEIYPQADVMNGCIYIISNIVEPGVIRKRGRVFKLCWGSDDFEPKRYSDIVSLFEEAFERVDSGSDIRLKQWRKFLFISPMAMLTSKYNISMDIAYSEHFEELRESMYEVVTLANAMGIELTQDDIEAQLKQASQVVSGAKTSMQLDIERGVTPELDSLVGYVVDEARNRDIEVPIYQENYKILCDKLQSNEGLDNE